jgi:quercetin dioxygenase-like cupin family protein
MSPLRWTDVPTEQMNPDLARQVIHAQRVTIARLTLRQGAVVPRHSHNNEQITLLQEGRLRFVFDDREFTISAGEAMPIPPDAPHRVEALEDSVAIDVFSPVREDWIRGDDAYLRR